MEYQKSYKTSKTLNKKRYSVPLECPRFCLTGPNSWGLKIPPWSERVLDHIFLENWYYQLDNETVRIVFSTKR